MKLHELFEDKERSILTVMRDRSGDLHGNFTCTSKNLTSLEGAPTTVAKSFDCSYNRIKSLKFAPKEIGSDFFCIDNDLTSLEGIPSIINGNLFISGNKLTSLHNIHKQIKRMGAYANFSNNPITSHVLGLLLVNGLYSINLDNPKVDTIMNKHLNGDRDVFACQEELIEAGLDEFAQL